MPTGIRARAVPVCPCLPWASAAAGPSAPRPAAPAPATAAPLRKLLRVVDAVDAGEESSGTGSPVSSDRGIVVLIVHEAHLHFVGCVPVNVRSWQ